MKTIHGISLLAAIAVISLSASPAAAQAPARHETAAQLRAQARISEKAARVRALAQVPGGTVKAGELEREHGKLLYSFDIVTKGRPGIDEVQIDAITGRVLSKTHETPAMEKAEAKADAHAANHPKP